MPPQVRRWIFHSMDIFLCITLSPRGHNQIAAELKQGCELHWNRLSGFLQNFLPYPHMNFFSLPPPEPNLQTQHSPINIRVCAHECDRPLPEVSAWFGCGGTSAPCNWAELCSSYTLSSTCPQVHKLRIKKPTAPLQR